jgi:2-aminoadipate transaminase
VLLLMTADRSSSPLPPPRFSQRRDWSSKQAISFLMQQGVENPGVISLAAGLVDPATLPVDEVRDTLADMLHEPAWGRIALQYGTTQGAESLRSQVLRHFAKLEGVEPAQLGIDTRRLVLTTGSQQLLALVTEALFDPGDIALVASPTYFVFLGTLNGVGARTVPIPSDADGMQMDALEAALEQIERDGQLDRVKLIYLVSYYENPSGISLSDERRRQAVEIARRWSKRQRIYILEDAAYRELRYDGPEHRSVWSYDTAREQVILAQTFSKTFSPGLRIGCGVLPEELVTPVCDRKGNEDFGSANFNQNLLARIMQHGLYATHVEQVRHGYRIKRDSMIAAADRYFSDIPGVDWVHPHGGLYVWMTLPEHIETGFESELFARAAKVEQVMYVPGELCYGGAPEQRPRNQMRLSFGVQDPEGIDQGMERLAKAVRYCLEVGVHA